MWTHPITLLLITALIGGIAYIVKLVIENNKIAYALAEVVKDIQDELKVSREERAEIRHDLDELRGQHYMMMKSGNMISSHDFKKKEQ